jgi:hypothetical protein
VLAPFISALEQIIAPFSRHVISYDAIARSDISVFKPGSVHQSILKGKVCAIVDIQENNYTNCIYNFSNKQQRVVDCADAFPAVLEGSHRFFRPHHPRLRSIYIYDILSTQ